MIRSKSTYKPLLSWLPVLVCFIIIIQTACDPAPLLLGKPTHISIASDSYYNTTLTLNSTVAANQSLFLTAESPFNDPFQQPIITIKSTDNFELVCDQQ